ncbi:MAG: PhoH family protein [Verrucomicrobiales bacterium]|nr:PhoH family protein [Verrucomicrobiales bacterium]
MKNYVLDTNVLLHDPNALLNFEENAVLIPIEVIEEIDRFKREGSELGQNARTVSRQLDALRAQGRLSQGVSLPNGGRLRILFGPHSENGNGPGTGARSRNGHNVDTRIIATALALREAEPQVPAILVTKDINLRIRADSLGLPAEDYETDRVQLTDLYSGTFECEVSVEEMNGFRESGEMELKRPHHPNEYCTLRVTGEGRTSALARVDVGGGRLIPVRDAREGVWGIKPRNREQHFALDALLNDDFRLVTLMGKAGTGKTLLALAAGLQRTVNDRQYRRLIVARPTVSVGRELGFLPGTLEEKLSPWMQPIHDSIELLGDLNMGQEGRRSADLLRSGLIVVEALGYIRGRSIANQFIIIDEAQNLTPIEVKTIVTRVGQGSKVVFTGDPYQIDNPYVDSCSNGFNHLVSRFRDQPIAAHLELRKGERSELAELAANLL